MDVLWIEVQSAKLVALLVLQIHRVYAPIGCKQLSIATRFNGASINLVYFIYGKYTKQRFPFVYLLDKPHRPR